jgi:hypothetical protein
MRRGGRAAILDFRDPIWRTAHSSGKSPQNSVFIVTVFERNDNPSQNTFPPLKPPLLPAETLRRVLRVARMNGASVLAISGVFALVSAGARDLSGAVVGLMVAASGAVELHGAALLRNGRENGMRWLVSSQVLLAAVVLAYVAIRIRDPDISAMREVLTDEQRSVIRQTGMSEDAFLVATYRFGYWAVAGATLAYQGAMTLYYARRQAPVAAALRDGEPLS